MGGFPGRRSQLPLPRLLVAVGLLLCAAIVLASCSGTGGPVHSAMIQASPISTQTPQIIVTPMITPAPTATATATPTATPVIAYVPDTYEQTAARSLLNSQAGVYGFAVLAADGTVVSAYNSTVPFVTASLYKLVVMADIFNRIEQGELSLDQDVYLEERFFWEGDGDLYFPWTRAATWVPMSEVLYAVGAWSSNVAAKTLLTFTNAQSLRETAVAIGMERTYLFASPWDLPYWPPQPGVDSSPEDTELARQFVEAEAEYGWVNITTPYDMAVYQLKLINGTLISPWVSEKIFGILEQQAIRDRMPVLLPWDMRVANKPGNLVGVVNDTGAIQTYNGWRAVATLSEAVPDEVHSTYILQLMALIAAGFTDLASYGG
jgi:beta-lactamase class A